MSENAIVTQDGEIVGEEQLNIGALRYHSPEEVVASAKQIANVLSQIIQEKALYTTIQGKQYVHVTGWSTLGSMVGVVPRELVEFSRLHEDGTWESAVELVRVSDGAVIGRASHLCGGPDDRDWTKRPSAVRKSMSVTRATGKAFRLSFAWIMALAGYEATPAEEMMQVVEHWTVTQNWGKFWIYVEQKLGLTRDQAHEALEVGSVTQYAGSKDEAMTALKNYAAALHGEVSA